MLLKVSGLLAVVLLYYAHLNCSNSKIYKMQKYDDSAPNICLFIKEHEFLKTFNISFILLDFEGQQIKRALEVRRQIKPFY
jgi:hypothetical protein